MARKCTTVPGYGVCCTAATQGHLGVPFRFTDSKGNQRCGECTTHPSQSRNPAKQGRTVFQFRFHRNQECGLGPHGCPALAGTAAPAGITYTTPALPYQQPLQIPYQGGIVPQYMQ